MMKSRKRNLFDDRNTKIVLESALDVIYTIAVLPFFTEGAVVGGVAFLADMGFGLSAIISGAIMGGLGFWAKKSTSKIALILAITLFALDGLLSVFLVIAVGGNPVPGSLVVRVIFIVSIFKGIKAIDQLKAES